MTNSSLDPLLKAAASKWPDDISIIRGSEQFTFRQVHRAVQQLASQFLAAGIHPGSKVGLLCPNGPEYVVGSFALFSIDAVVVPVFPGLKEPEVAALAKELSLDTICFTADLEKSVPSMLLDDIFNADVMEISASFRIGRPSIRILLEDDNANKLPRPAPLIRFTSGTTSASKGVIIPQAAMVEYTRRFVQAYAIKQGDGILDLLSMAHIFYQITAAMMCGAKLIVGDNTRTEAIGETIRRGRITHIDAAPSFYTACLAATDLRGEDLRSVRYITSCGAPLADKVAVEFRHRFGREILQRYGLTETGPVLINYDENPRKRGSLGTAAPGCEIQLRGQDHERDDEGEILVRCKGLFSGYFSPWTSQNDTLNNGWFCTGDLARKDADGFYWMTGRTKSIINVGAVKVFPGELEAILLSHQNIEEAHVFPAEDARFGEVPHAQVILRPGSSASEQDLLRYVNRSLSVFKAVRRIEIVGQISKTLTGKIKRHERSQTR